MEEALRRSEGKSETTHMMTYQKLHELQALLDTVDRRDAMKLSESVQEILPLAIVGQGAVAYVQALDGDASSKDRYALLASMISAARDYIRDQTQHDQLEPDERPSA